MTDEARLAIALGVAEECGRCKGTGRTMVFVRGPNASVTVRRTAKIAKIVASSDIMELSCTPCNGTGAVSTDRRLVD